MTSWVARRCPDLYNSPAPPRLNSFLPRLSPSPTSPASPRSSTPPPPHVPLQEHTTIWTISTGSVSVPVRTSHSPAFLLIFPPPRRQHFPQF